MSHCQLGIETLGCVHYSELLPVLLAMVAVLLGGGLLTWLLARDTRGDAS